MRYGDLSAHMQGRFARSSVCPICGKHVGIIDDFQTVSFRNGRNMIHTFLHTNCLLTSKEREVSNAKEEFVGRA